MSPITTHILDTSLGRPAAGVRVVLERHHGGAFTEVATGITDADGRVRDLLAPGALTRGVWRLVFETGPYFAARGVAAFYPMVPVVFEVTAPGEHHHVPLLLNPFGYATYRGS